MFDNKRRRMQVSKFMQNIYDIAAIPVIKCGLWLYN